MSNDLLKQLEDKINEAIDTIELSRMEITELKEQKDELENRYADWEEKLSALIDKFEQLEDNSNLENNNNIEESSQEGEIDDNDSVKAENMEGNEENLEYEETKIDSVDNSDQLEASAEVEEEDTDQLEASAEVEEEDTDQLEASAEIEEEDTDQLEASAEVEEEDSEAFLAQDSSEDEDEIDEPEGSVFGTNAASYTESPGSTQHYA